MKSAAWLKTFDPWRPDTVPVSGESAVMATLLAEALKPVIVLPPILGRQRVDPGEDGAVVWGVAKAKVKRSRAPTLMATLPEVPVLVPDVAVNVPVVAMPV